MQKLKKWLTWLDQNILTLLVSGYIFIIPLYPKLPLKMINYTYIAVRLEDLYVALVALVFFIQFIRKKVTLNKKYLLLFGIFWTAVFVSFLYNWLVTKIIVIQHLGLLHSLRRVEYMFIFFVIGSTIQTKKDVVRYLKLSFVAFALVCIYGIGQKFLGWPAVQTMNPEYAKGYLLVLDAYARISSTFAGHYDFAAYLIFLMPIILGFFIAKQQKKYFALFALGLVTLILTASRASYLSYIGSVILFLLYVRKFKLLIVVIALTALLTPLSDTLTSRLTRTFQQTQIFVNPDTGEVIVPKDLKPDELPPGDFGANINAKAIAQNQGKRPVFIDPKLEIETKKAIKEKIIQEASKSGKTLTEEEIRALVDQAFGEQIPITKYLIDISLSTRFQVSWPRAIVAFSKNILLGTGPSSMGEATDGDYFRWLAEFGLFGTISFLLILGSIMKEVFVKAKNMIKKDPFGYVLYGFFFGTIGLFVNASYIDVFEASKVAYTFWLVAGLFVASLPVLGTKVVNKSKN